MSHSLLHHYDHFVDTLLSKPSKDLDLLVQRLYFLEETGVNIASLLTGAVGLSAESGEFTEVVKKLILQGKPLDDATLFHLKRELGDIIFYWFVACQALHVSAEGVIVENIAKLESRYPGGKFDINYSEVRKDGDV
jgi:NTP pyrophosphatase (non-canonical NTP hydrolase)